MLFLRLAFVAWAKLSRRSRDLARELGAELVFFSDKPPYTSAFRKTRKVLEDLEPDAVFVQLLQGPLLWLILRLSRRLSFKVIADVHTGFVYTTSFRGYLLNKPFNHMLRDCDLVIAHNPLQRSYMVENLQLDKSKTIVVYDPVPKPVEDPAKPGIDMVQSLRATFATTTREYTVLLAIWKAVGFDKPFITSDTIAVRSVVGDYPCLFQYTKESLSKAIEERK